MIGTAKHGRSTPCPTNFNPISLLEEARKIGNRSCRHFVHGIRSARYCEPTTSVHKLNTWFKIGDSFISNGTFGPSPANAHSGRSEDALTMKNAQQVVHSIFDGFDSGNGTMSFAQHDKRRHAASKCGKTSGRNAISTASRGNCIGPKECFPSKQTKVQCRLKKVLSVQGVKVDHLVNLNLHSGNDGIVLDVSNSGLDSATQPSQVTSGERHFLKIYWRSGRRL